MPLFSKKIIPTDITSNIEKAVNPTVEELDWALVFQICGSINQSDMGAKEARKLLQKKMISNDPKTQVLALEILNSLSENCAPKFQPQLAAKSFGEDLYHLASSKVSDKLNNSAFHLSDLSKTLDDRVSGKLVQCLESWVSQTGGDPQFGSIRRAYDVMTQGNVLPYNTRQSPTDVKSDIEIAKNSAQLFFQTLSFTDPTKEDISKNELIQQVLASHLQLCDDSEMISALINANNELLSCFKAYDEMLEQNAMNEATKNSQTLHSRSTRPQPSNASVEMKQPDQLALNEWFTKKENRTMSKKTEKDRAVIDWMNDVERQSKSLLTNKKYQRLIQFKSEAGKRWANSILANASLLPPDDGCRKHYVPRRLLSSSIQQHNFKSNATEAASKIQMIWKEYQNKSSQNALENQVGMAAMASTGQRTPIAGMVQLVQMLHQSLDIQKQKSHHRMVKLESLLKEETRKRQEAEANIKRLESMYCTTEKRQSLLKKVAELEKEENKRTMKKQPSTQSTASKKSVRSRKSLVPESPMTKTTHLRSSSIAITRNVPIKPAVAPPSTARRLTVAPHVRRPIQ
ncbi:hypothetical protein EDC96DRAFT_437891 [Choanephora cucurbitarum]|nr:hypothetical protein EDC96DRAFT_437891 [Choanephora cucurbitarum]